MDWFVIGSAVYFLAVAGAAAVLVRRALRLAMQAAPATRLEQLAIEVAELRDLYGYLLESHKKLRARTWKRNKIAERDDEVPDWRIDPTAARRALEEKHGIPSLG